MSCINVTLTRVSSEINVTVSAVCSTSEGVPYIFDVDENRIQDSEGYYLIDNS